MTLTDVARAAEVSVATVSNALNGTGRMAGPTRARVRATATALGYGEPPPRTLALAVTTYGTLSWDFAGIPFYARAISAATAAAHRRGYALIALPAAPAETLWRTLPVAGAVLLDSPPGDPVVRVLRARGLPLVFDGRPARLGAREAWVDNDHRATTHEVLDHLASRGARRIALVAGPGEEHYTRSCRAAYEEWSAAHGNEARVVPLDFADTEGRTLDALLAGPGRPDAVHGIYDPCGRRVLASAARRGLRVPEDLLVVCASEDPAYETSAPPVSTVTLAPHRTARAAVDALVDLVEGAPGGAGQTIGARLTPRESSLRGRRLPRVPPDRP